MPRLSIVLLGLLLASCARRPAQESPAPPGSFAPHLSRSGSRVVLSWIEPESSGTTALRYVVGDGTAWGAPKTAARDAALASDGADVPGVVPLGDTGLAAYWTQKRGSSTVARNLVVSVSSDDGTSWGLPASPHRDDTDSEHAMASLVPAATSGGFGITWLDGRAAASTEYGEGGTSLYWSEWRGGAFGDEVLLDPRVCDCCKTSAAWGPDGPIVAYRDRDDRNRRDVSIVRRSGATWSGPRGVHEDGWSLSACPTNGPAVASRDDRLAVAWFTSVDATPSVWAVLSADAGKTIGDRIRLDGGAPVGRVDAAMLVDGSAAIVWLERHGSEAAVRVRRVSTDGRLSKPMDIATTSPSRASGYPTIVAMNGGVALVAWTDTSPVRRVRVARVLLP